MNDKSRLDYASQPSAQRKAPWGKGKKASLFQNNCFLPTGSSRGQLQDGSREILANPGSDFSLCFSLSF